jgi:hypothetical protein
LHMNSSGLAGSSAAEAAVVLADCAGGDELESVHDALVGSLNTPAVLIRQADIGSIPISLDLDTGILDIAGCRVRPTVVWARHWAACTIAAQARPPGSVSSLDAASWSELIRQITESTAAALPGAAPVTPGQLIDAARLGVSTPRTVVTTDVLAGVKLMRSPRVVIKTANFRLYEPDPRVRQAHWPRIIGRDAISGGEAVHGRPVLVQEYVDHVSELRVYYLNGGICAFGVHKPEPSSPWTDPVSVTVTRIDCPPDAADVVRALCTAWKLHYGAFDLLVTHDGETVFLEANQDGDWLWYERKARWHGVSFMAAIMVRELFSRVIR